MAVGDTITAARYNQLQARINGVMGKGAGDEGYGQALSSFQVSANATVEADHMSRLFEDIKKSRVHQTGSLPSEIADMAVGDLIEDSNPTTKKGLAEFEALSLDVVADRLNIATGQSSVETGVSSFTDTDWNGTIYHEVTVTFQAYNVTNGDGTTTNMTASDHRRAFFNAGGEIVFSGSLASGGGAIDTDWRNLLTNVGLVRFGHSATSNGSEGTVIGHTDLTTTYQTIFTKTASSYADNDFTIQAKEDANDGPVLRFRIYFNDDKGPNPNFDEAVTPRTTSTVQCNRPNNTNSVDVNKPVFANARNLS
jgi:hypothetical protein